jgi:alpha-D-ribose 1-methylphosphonate 5-triphosphate synthase subunit PhnL
MLSVEGLSKQFVIHGLDHKEIVGFEDVTFGLERDGALALSGPSGSGKSSALKCIFRTYLPTGGAIRYQSESCGEVDLARASAQTILRLRAQEIGYVTQFLKVLPRMPALDVVAEPLVNGPATRRMARKKASVLLEELQIPRELFDAYPSTFSGGEQQRVNIARAVIRRPRLLLLDEPTASLDRASVAIVIEILKELRDRGTTMVMIFHDRAIMDALADSVCEMEARPGPVRPEAAVC